MVFDSGRLHDGRVQHRDLSCGLACECISVAVASPQKKCAGGRFWLPSGLNSTSNKEFDYLWCKRFVSVVIHVVKVDADWEDDQPRTGGSRKLDGNCGDPIKWSVAIDGKVPAEIQAVDRYRSALFLGYCHDVHQ